MSLEDFHARRRAELDFLDLYRAELIQRLKATLAETGDATWLPEDLEQFLPENIAKTLRAGGKPALAARYLAAWEDLRSAMDTCAGLSEPLTDSACELWEDARSVLDAAWEQVERVQAQVDDWLK